MARARIWKTRLTVFCPACRLHFPWLVDSVERPADIGEHTIPIAGEFPPVWTFDGNVERPTLQPSLDCHYKYNDRGVEREYRCHSFIADGRIQYLTDCTHPLAGQTVDLEEITE